MKVSKNGWSAEETALLMTEAQRGRQEGRPLRGVFAQVAEATGRKPNSIRNYYYSQAREGGGPSFVPFTEAEVRSLIREILLAQGRGVSVRRAALTLGGDKSAMLRLQNKYRSVIRQRSELVCDVMRELSEAGLTYYDPYGEREARARGEVAPDEIRRLRQAVQELCAEIGALRMMTQRRQAEVDELHSRMDGIDLRFGGK